MSLRRIEGLFRKRVAVIDPDACRKCSLCVKACPLGAISGAPRVVPEVNEALCIGCGICVNACPFNAITLKTRWSILPIAALATVLVLAVLAGLWVYHAYMTPPPGPVEAPARDVPGVFQLPYEDSKETLPPPEYYATLEEEAGTEGG
ncbi:MAG: 4Fe-4S binding protein [Desulfurococcales archaeon]|nr:4Fe-4S binding protein [Desulfurococcales archaeon]